MFALSSPLAKPRCVGYFKSKQGSTHQPHPQQELAVRLRHRGLCLASLKPRRGALTKDTQSDKRWLSKFHSPMIRCHHPRCDGRLRNSCCLRRFAGFACLALLRFARVLALRSEQAERAEDLQEATGRPDDHLGAERCLFFCSICRGTVAFLAGSPDVPRSAFPMEAIPWTSL